MLPSKMEIGQGIYGDARVGWGKSAVPAQQDCIKKQLRPSRCEYRVVPVVRRSLFGATAKAAHWRHEEGGSLFPSAVSIAMAYRHYPLAYPASLKSFSESSRSFVTLASTARNFATFTLRIMSQVAASRDPFG
jgi:hypothetical protein